MQFAQTLRGSVVSRRAASFFIIGVLAGISIIIWLEVWVQTPRGVLTFAVLNIGQGDALYIESPAGVQVLFDGGPDGSVLRELPAIMPPFDHSLDAVIESHPDADHIGGLVPVLARYSVGAFIEPGIVRDEATANALEKKVMDANVPRYIAVRGMTLDLGGGAELRVLYPDHDVSRLMTNFDNEGSIVAQLTYGRTAVLLTGDAPQDIENKLAALDGESLRSTILKVGHHGSRFSTGARFAAAVAPSLAVISVGARNTYGHPSKEALAVLAQSNIPVLRTDEQGTLLFRSDGVRFWRVAR